MTNTTTEKYFWWMVSLVSPGKFRHEKLFRALHGYNFTPILSLDSNRYEDGVNLRYQFGYQNDIPDSKIAAELDQTPCSVLEMMVALAYRCEEHIMEDEDIGSRTSRWFWVMLGSMGLTDMDDDHYDKSRVDWVVRRFLARKYDRNGAGGLFTTKYSTVDMRTVEIWYQLAVYLQENT